MKAPWIARLFVPIALFVCAPFIASCGDEDSTSTSGYDYDGEDEFTPSHISVECGKIQLQLYNGELEDAQIPPSASLNVVVGSGSLELPSGQRQLVRVDMNTSNNAEYTAAEYAVSFPEVNSYSFVISDFGMSEYAAEVNYGEVGEVTVERSWKPEIIELETSWLAPIITTPRSPNAPKQECIVSGYAGHETFNIGDGPPDHSVTITR
ncbi:MAG TPA: hypothetical protein PKB15_02060 [Acidimicrobiia bacterium]|nr:hypothetical protein [Acidimicrobiia bacterium]